MSFCSSILQDCAFYSQAEQAAYRQKVAGLVKLSSHEYEKKKGRLLLQPGALRPVGLHVQTDPGQWGRQELIP